MHRRLPPYRVPPYRLPGNRPGIANLVVACVLQRFAEVLTGERK